MPAASYRYGRMYQRDEPTKTPLKNKWTYSKYTQQ